MTNNPNNKAVYKLDPTDSYEEVTEYSAEDNYYQCGKETPVEAQEYITELERRLSAKNEAVKALLSATSENLSFHRNSLIKTEKI